jgi:hypothetical protein
VPFVGHSAKPALPRAALGKVRLSATSLFTECWTLGTGPHSTTTRLPSVKHSAKVALGKGPLDGRPKADGRQFCRELRIGTRQRVFFAECHIMGTRQRTLCLVSSLDIWLSSSCHLLRINFLVSKEYLFLKSINTIGWHRNGLYKQRSILCLVHET